MIRCIRAGHPAFQDRVGQEAAVIRTLDAGTLAVRFADGKQLLLYAGDYEWLSVPVAPSATRATICPHGARQQLRIDWRDT